MKRERNIIIRSVGLWASSRKATAASKIHNLQPAGFSGNIPIRFNIISVKAFLIYHDLVVVPLPSCRKSFALLLTTKTT
jgi:hypothetical protein